MADSVPNPKRSQVGTARGSAERTLGRVASSAAAPSPGSSTSTNPPPGCSVSEWCRCSAALGSPPSTMLAEPRPARLIRLKPPPPRARRQANRQSSRRLVKKGQVRSNLTPEAEVGGKLCSISLGKMLVVPNCELRARRHSFLASRAKRAEALTHARQVGRHLRGKRVYVERRATLDQQVGRREREAATTCSQAAQSARRRPNTPSRTPQTHRVGSHLRGNGVCVVTFGARGRAGTGRRCTCSRCLKQCRQQDHTAAQGQGRHGGRGMAHAGAWWQAGPRIVEQGRAASAQGGRFPARSQLGRRRTRCRQQVR
jgi:hypothetical protein